ncbi:MAG: threonine synthase [Candidatus Micrarchaeia archaeon]
MDYKLKCIKCGKEFDSSYKGQLCDSCNSILYIEYIKANKRSKLEFNGSFWDLEDMLPKAKYKHYMLGATPLIPSLNNSNLLLKLETANPTHSFKDRGSIVELAKAQEYGYNEVVCASTGNMAYSIAYYAKLAGIRAKIFISKNASKDKVRDIRETHDADIEHVDGDFTKAQKLAERYAKEHNVFLAGDYGYRREGQRTIGFELAFQARNIDYIFTPVGNATLISGLIKAWLEMLDMKIIKKIPKIVGVEASLSAPLYKAFINNEKVKYVSPKTKADAIAVGYPTFGDEVLENLRGINGSIMTVTDKEMQIEQNRFYREYGQIAELAAVASIVAYRKLKPKGKAVAIISGGNI